MTSILFSIFGIYLFIFVGSFAKRHFKAEMDERTITLLSVYFLQPFLTFWGLLKRPIDTSLVFTPMLYLGVVFISLLLMLPLVRKLFSDNKERSIATVAALIGNTGNLGIPLGIWAARSDPVERIVRPVLDLMQTMPAFVYLIPAAMFFGLGRVPGVVATIIFAMPPAVRLTNLGIRQVPEELIETGLAFGCTSGQLLLKVQLPTARPSIMAGVNQTIMLALSMVVIASMIGAGGLGDTVLRGIQRLDVGLGFEGGLGVVILAIILDRITQSFGK